MRMAGRRSVITATILFGVVGGMLGLAFAAVPLYRMFCQVTGYAGTPRTENVTASTTVTGDTVTVKFDANVNSKLPWRFEPAQRQVDVHLGEEKLVFFRAHNLSDHAITGTATFNVAPDEVAQYFVKIQCFCFTEQRLAPGETVMMPVSFYVDPDLAKDPDASVAKIITLSYTFFPLDEGGDSSADGTAANDSDRTGS